MPLFSDLSTVETKQALARRIRLGKRPPLYSFPARLTCLRRDTHYRGRPLSLREAARRMGINHTYLYRVEEAKERPSRRLILQVGDLFNLNVDTYLAEYGYDYEISKSTVDRVAVKRLTALAFRLHKKHVYRLIRRAKKYLTEKPLTT